MPESKRGIWIEDLASPDIKLEISTINHPTGVEATPVAPRAEMPLGGGGGSQGSSFPRPSCACNCAIRPMSASSDSEDALVLAQPKGSAKKEKLPSKQTPSKSEKLGKDQRPSESKKDKNSDTTKDKKSDRKDKEKKNRKAAEKSVSEDEMDVDVDVPAPNHGAVDEFDDDFDEFVHFSSTFSV